MNELKPLLRCIVMVQVFLLFAALALPGLVFVMAYDWGKIVYATFACLCLAQALFLRRAVDQLG